jgi:DNA-binding CsgD family transcriptional regulator
MFSITLFADFNACATADAKDRRILRELINVRDSSSARFVNLSVYDYRRSNPDSRHFLTYPNEWISRYARYSYSNVDPLLSVDYRRVSHIDWRDLHRTGEQAALFAKFTEFGLGNNAVSVINHGGRMLYLSLSLVFDSPHAGWEGFKQEHMGLFRFEADRITTCYKRIYENEPKAERRLTRRELQALQLVARGNTDAQIAMQLGIGKWTVVSHLQSAKYKLGCTNRVSAVAKAIADGVINLTEMV